MDTAYRYVTGRTMSMTWLLTVGSLAWIAVQHTSVVAWFACAIAVAMPALIFMVLAHSPAKTIAEIIHDLESPRLR